MILSVLLVVLKVACYQGRQYFYGLNAPFDIPPVSLMGKTYRCFAGQLTVLPDGDTFEYSPEDDILTLQYRGMAQTHPYGGDSDVKVRRPWRRWTDGQTAREQRACPQLNRLQPRHRR